MIAPNHAPKDPKKPSSQPKSSNPIQSFGGFLMVLGIVSLLVFVVTLAIALPMYGHTPDWAFYFLLAAPIGMVGGGFLVYVSSIGTMHGAVRFRRPSGFKQSCPKCYYMNSIDENFCGHCGHRLH